MDILLKTYRDSVAIKLPDEEEWKRMPLYEKRSVEERLQMLIKDMKNIGRIYNVNLLQLLPRHLMAEYDYPFCDIANFARQSIAAVEQFFATDAEREKPYSTASTRRRRKYIEELYAAFSATTGYNPPLVFEKRAPNSLGAYNNERNRIILNKLLLEEENPRKIIRTLLHEARHAFQRFAVEHPWRAKPDESNIYSWEFSIENYISSDVDFNMYQSQSIEADADDFAQRVVFSSQII